MILTLFESVQKAYTRPEQIMNFDWPVIAQFLTTFNKAKAKENVELFNLWQFKTTDYEQGRKYIYENQERTEKYEEIQGTIRRCKANAEGSWGIVLDYDGERGLADVLEELINFEFAIYTTYRHDPSGAHKFRVVLPFNRLISRDSFKAKKTSISETFKQVDHASFSESQSFYLHSGPDESKAFAYHNKGVFLDPDWFEDEVQPTYEPMVKQNLEYSGDRSVYKEMLIESLATCSGLHYNGPSKYNVLTLVALCKSAEITFEEYDILCRNMMAPDSSLTDSKLRRSAWTNWKVHSGITSRVREEFIKDHGGTSVFGKQMSGPVLRSSAEIRAYIKETYGS